MIIIIIFYLRNNQIILQWILFEKNQSVYRVLGILIRKTKTILGI